MKLTTKKLKQLIKEELEEAYRDKFGKPTFRGKTSPPMHQDLYMRTDPNFKPSPVGDYKHDPDFDEVEAQAKALLAVIDLVPEIVTDDPKVAEKMKEMAPEHADKIKLK